MTTLPTNWTAVPIRELMQPLQDGKLVHQGWSPQCESGPALTASDWGALKTTAIQDGSYQPEHNKRLPEALDAKERLEVKVGDLLMTCAGPRVRCGVACLVRETPPKRFISGKMYRFRANEALIDSRLLEAFLRTPSTKAQIDAMKTGISESGMNITHEKFSQLIVPIAPLSEQKRIADKLDTVLTRVEAVNTRLARVAPLLKRFRQSVLAAATSGRLTEDWRGANGLSRPWPLVLLGEVARDFSYGSAAKSSPAGHVPVLRMGNIQDGALDWSDLVFTSDPAEIAKYRLQDGDVLFNRTNSPELVGKTAVFRGEREAIYAGYLIRVRCSSDLLPDYLNYCLGSPAGKHYCWQVKSDGVSQSNINAKKLAAFSFGLPSLDEQTEIVRRVETLFAFADRLEARLAQAQTAATRLTPALLAKAFRGELVPQDPNDEPAAELLRRLQAERASAPKASTGRGRKAAVQV